MPFHLVKSFKIHILSIKGNNFQDLPDWGQLTARSKAGAIVNGDIFNISASVLAKDTYQNAESAFFQGWGQNVQ